LFQKRRSLAPEIIVGEERRVFMKYNANAFSYGIIAGILTITLPGNNLNLLITNVLLGLIAGKLMDKS